MSLEEEPPSSASAEQSSSLTSPLTFPNLTRRPSRPLALAPARPRFVVGAAANEFRQEVTSRASKRAEWNDWRWQNRNRIRSLAQLERMIRVTDEEREAISRHEGPLPIGVTPYYMSLVDPGGSGAAAAPHGDSDAREFDRVAGEEDDPLGEDGTRARCRASCTGIPTGCCCSSRTSARSTAGTARVPAWSAPAASARCKKADIDRAIEYIESTPAVRDVLISGGDPLSASTRTGSSTFSARSARDQASRVHPHRQRSSPSFSPCA